jgi:hypothetical protein
MIGICSRVYETCGVNLKARSAVLGPDGGAIIALTRTLNLLASIRHEDDPTIGELLAAVPDLQKMDWINRFGPARAWERVASDIETDALEWLTKALVITEREFDWVGGSVAAPIWLYRAYSTRVGADADALANWVLRNRARNEYVPFGRRTSARSVEEWRAEEKGRQLHREELRLIEEQQKKERWSASSGPSPAYGKKN